MAVVRKYQNNFTTGELSPGVHARVDLQKYASGCKTIQNAVVYAHGGISMRPGTRMVDEVPGDGLLIPFVYSVTQAYVLCFYNSGATHARMRVYKEGGVVLNGGTVYEVVTPYLPADLPQIKFAQSADTMFLVHPDYKPRTLTRSGHASWTFAEMHFTPDNTISAPTLSGATASGFTGDSPKTTTYYKVAAVTDQEVESKASNAKRATTMSTWPSGAQVVLNWGSVTGAVRYEIYKNDRGYYAWIGSATGTTFTDDCIEGDSTKGPKNSRDPFIGVGNYPGAVGIYQQRLVFGRSNNDPQTVWCSETGSFDSMAVAEPLRDDSAITVTIDSKQMNEVRHFIPLRDMLVLTSGAEFKMGAGSNGDAISPMSIRFDIQSYWGSSDVPPIVVGTSILLVQNSGRAVRDVHYQLSEDGYSGNEVSILAEHLLTSPVRDWAYQQSPFSTVWICREDGKLLTLTYMREQDIFAWSRHESSGGKFRSVSVIREGSEDNVYFLVRRGDRYFVEYQERWHYGDSIKTAFYVDSGLSYSGGTATCVVTGLGHLNGKKVVALADGSVVKDLTVSGGTVQLPHAASRITVGLPYEMLVRTLDPEIRAENGTAVGEKRNVVRAVAVVRETRGLEIGPTDAQLVPMKFPMPEKYGEAPPLYTGEIDVVLPGSHRNEATITIRQAEPLPATILGLATVISVG